MIGELVKGVSRERIDEAKWSILKVGVFGVLKDFENECDFVEALLVVCLATFELSGKGLSGEDASSFDLPGLKKGSDQNVHQRNGRISSQNSVSDIPDPDFFEGEFK